MDKEKFKKAISSINPRDGFIDETISMLNRRAQDTKKLGVAKYNFNIAAGRKSIAKIAGIGGVAAALIAIAVLAAVSGLFSASDSPEVNPPVIANASAPANTETPRKLVLDGSPVLYSSLDFGYTKKIEYPKTSGSETACLAIVHEEDILGKSQLILKGTVEDAKIKEYFQNAKTAVYQIRIDRIYYSVLNVNEGDIFTLEQELYGGSLCDMEFGMQPGGQYILPIREGNGVISEYDIDENQHTAKLESPYTITYPFQPMIQATVDGGYLFYGGKDENGQRFGWGSLVDENTVDVTMDVETVYGRESHINNMKLCADDDFEEDFQALVDYCCLGAGQSKISRDQAVNIAEETARGIEPKSHGYYDPVHLEWVITVELWYPEENVTVHVSPSGEVLGVDHGENSGEGNTEIIDVGVNEIDEPSTVNDIVVPFYLPQRLSDGTKVHCGISKNGYRAWIWNGDMLLVDITYLDADSEYLKGAPEKGKAAVTAKDGKLELVMMINEDIGCIMKAGGISLEELIKTAGSFGNDKAPANNMPYNRGYD